MTTRATVPGSAVPRSAASAVVHWSDLTGPEIAALAPATVAILPVAAIEQHGPHLPVDTDLRIGTGILAALERQLPASTPAVVLPPQAIGKSDEHLDFPGTLTLSAETMIAVLRETGAAVARAGLRRLILFSSHGGNPEVCGIAARDLRRAHGMWVVPVHWMDLGLPDAATSAAATSAAAASAAAPSDPATAAPLFEPWETTHGIHGGAIETSMMLHLAPESVRRDRLARFESRGAEIAAGARVLTATGPAGLAWLTRDLNPAGALGDATAGDAACGQRLVEHAAARLAALVGDLAALAPPGDGA